MLLGGRIVQADLYGVMVITPCVVNLFLFSLLLLSVSFDIIYTN